MLFDFRAWWAGLMAAPPVHDHSGKDLELNGEFCSWLQSAGNLSSGDVATVRNMVRVVRCNAGKTLFGRGDVVPDLFFVRTGLVRLFYLTADGREFNKNFVGSGGVATSLSSFLEDGPAPFHAECLADTLLIALPIALVRDLRADSLGWERLIGGFIARLALSKERREASFLLQDAAARYEAFLADFRDIAGMLPQYHIASYLGITPVALSRIRSRRARPERS